ncbi:hypothetical protein [Pseudomonas leptonychotis]|uniref:hypothetical protein n=1 Tax=Pseudomonas leptonychotis TaxID=2448482 RepID=UPI0039F03B2F
MFPLSSPYISSDLIADLDQQLMRLGCCGCHVYPGPVLVGISWGAAPKALDHRALDSYLEAELIARRVNNLQCTSDSERSRILAEVAL